MGRIAGHYEWDDDALRPGQRDEGGLHQNLFDEHGHLKGHARFIPSDDDGDEPLIITHTVYVPAEERRDEVDLVELIENVVKLLEFAVETAPVVIRWWQETAQPAIQARRERRNAKRERRKAHKSATAVGGPIVEAAQEPAVPLPAQALPDMSSAEAQARYLAALAARAFAEEQLRLITNAHILDVTGDPQTELPRVLAQLPAEQLRQLLQQMITDPTLLAEDKLAALASVLQPSAPAVELPAKPAPTIRS